MLILFSARLTSCCGDQVSIIVINAQSTHVRYVLVRHVTHTDICVGVQCMS